MAGTRRALLAAHPLAVTNAPQACNCLPRVRVRPAPGAGLPVVGRRETRDAPLRTHFLHGKPVSLTTDNALEQFSINKDRKLLQFSLF